MEPNFQEEGQWAEGQGEMAREQHEAGQWQQVGEADSSMYPPSENGMQDPFMSSEPVASQVPQTDQFAQEQVPEEAEALIVDASPTEDPFSMNADFSAMEKQRAAFEDAIAKRAEEERGLQDKNRKQAEEELDNFYDERTDQMAHRQSLNREKEELGNQERGDSKGGWTKVCELVDLKGQADEDQRRDKMRSLFIQLKSEASAEDQ
ncbi:unnamed protein product [Chrysoparadoxa australica]